MGTYKNGPLGPFKGKIGPLFGYILRGKGVLRAAPHITKPRSIKQLAVQERMVVLSPFLNKIKKYLAVGFELSAIKNENSANNSAKSYNLKHAIKGEYPELEVDYSQARLTEGSLEIPQNARAEAVENGFKFSWDFDENGAGHPNDKTMLMAYFPELKSSTYMINGVGRHQGQEILEIHPALKGKTAETYMSFITDDRKAISNSVYTGSVTF